MASFYGWSSTVSRLQPLRRDSVLFTTKTQEVVVLIWSTSKGWKTESTLEPPSGFKPRVFGSWVQCPNHLTIALSSFLSIDVLKLRDIELNPGSNKKSHSYLSCCHWNVNSLPTDSVKLQHWRPIILFINMILYMC